MSAPIIKVALCGTHGVGKTYITDLIARRAQNIGWDAHVVYSPTRHVKGLGADYGMANNKDGDWHFQWHVMSLTQLRAWEVEKSIKLWREDTAHNTGKNATTPALIIGDRCCWDPVAYTKDLINRINITRKPLDSPEVYRRLKLLDVYRLGHEQARTDTFWDKVFWKPHHPDHLDADPDRLADREYQLAVESQFFDILPKGIDTLDIDRDKAADEVWDWVFNEAQARMVSR